MFRLFLSALAFLTLTTACTTSPTSGRPIFTGLVSEQSEAGIGADEHGKVLKQYGVNDTQDLNFMVARIGARLAPYAERKDVRWTFTVLDDPMVNAFAIPGGYIYITRGLLALAEDEAEVAAVLAHEMGHVNARHTAQQMSQGLLANIGLQALGAATGSNVAAQLGSVGADLYLKSYSRTHEYEADALSVRYLAEAGYDVTATERFLRQLDRSTQFESRMAGKAANQFSYLSTHPQTPDRITRAHALAQQVGGAPQGTVNRTGFLQTLNGTVYGDNGKGGFIHGQEFIHPALKIRYRVPDGFTLKNTDSAVLASDGQGSGIVFDMARAQTDDPTIFLTQVWAAQAAPQNVEAITVNGLMGATAAVQGQGGKEARLVALSAGNGRFYRLLFVTPAGRMNAYATAFRRTTYSFAQDPHLAAASPARIKIISVRSGDTIASLSTRMQTPDFPLERFCLLNNLSPNDTLPLGEQVKIVQ